MMDFPSSSPGDPLTPGVGATPDAKRLALGEATSLTRIPVLPISWGDAQPLLAALRGPMVPEAMRAAQILKKEFGLETRVINMHTLKPIDEPAIIRAARETGVIVTAEGCATV